MSTFLKKLQAEKEQAGEAKDEKLKPSQMNSCKVCRKCREIAKQKNMLLPFVYSKTKSELSERLGQFIKNSKFMSNCADKCMDCFKTQKQIGIEDRYAAASYHIFKFFPGQEKEKYKENSEKLVNQENCENCELYMRKIATKKVLALEHAESLEELKEKIKKYADTTDRLIKETQKLCEKCFEATKDKKYEKYSERLKEKKQEKLRDFMKQKKEFEKK